MFWLSTLSKISFKEEAVKYFCRMSAVAMHFLAKISSKLNPGHARTALWSSSYVYGVLGF